MPDPNKPRIEIVFKRGKPTAAFLHLREGESGKTPRQIPIRPPMNAYYDAAGNPSGLEIPLPITVSVAQVNEALRELGPFAITESDYAPLRTL